MAKDMLKNAAMIDAIINPVIIFFSYFLITKTSTNDSHRRGYLYKLYTTIFYAELSSVGEIFK
jgi:hypothetical protein